LFVRELPRLSVDIDLTYLPFENRDTALKGISDGLERIKKDLLASIPHIQVTFLPQSNNQETKLRCKFNNAQIKIEVNTTIRGYLQEPRFIPVTNTVQNKFSLFAASTVVAQGELYGGKICAALDRQHPRDLFDIQKLFENEGLTKEIRLGFIAALLCSNRPINEVLKPNFQNQRIAFESQFAGMTNDPFSYEDYKMARKRLVREIHKSFTEDDRKLLVSFKMGQPEWSLYPFKNLKKMPAVKWKLQNIQKLLLENPVKHTQESTKLKRCLDQGHL